jgi:hypothetical protein
MSAIAALCDHATTVQAFFDRALWQPVECARFDIFYDAVRPALRRDPGSGWSCDTAADWCGRRAVDDAVKLRTDVAVADIVEAARAKFRDLDTERKTLLETASKLYPAAIRECLDRGLVDSAVRAVEHLGDVLRGLRDAADDWSDHRGALTVAVGKARVFAGAPPKGAANKPKAKRPAPKQIVQGDRKFYGIEICREFVEWVSERGPKQTVVDAAIEFCDTKGINAMTQLNRYEGDKLPKVLKRWHDSADKALRRAGADIRTDKARTSRPRRQRKAKAGNRRRP